MTFFKLFNLNFLMALLVLALPACTGENQNTVDLPKDQAQKILTAYLQVKDALVQSDGEATQQAALSLVAALGEVETELLNKIRVDAKHIAETVDTAHQRDHFSPLSDNMYSILKSTKVNETPVYRQYCPMAFEGKGGYWLAAEKEVNNPYFGDMMLHCGSVKEEL